MKTHSEAAFHEAKSILVGGVNSPVRAFKGVGGTPIFFESATGATMTSLDQKKYIDYVLSWGPMLLGHAHPTVIKAIQIAAAKGTSFGAPNQQETQLAQLIQSFYPNMEKVRLVNSGTEAGMSVIRLARGFTKKSKIIKFAGCYHGHGDALLVSTGSGGLTLGVPDSKGVTKEAAKDTLCLEYNDIDAVKTVFSTYQSDIAAVILEPITGNMGVIRPSNAFLEAIQTGCQNTGAILIFDEVMCGFRVHPNGAQGLLGITPDLTMLGKVIGGGLPCGAYGGRAEIMNHISPEGAVYQAGTLSGNPVVMAAGIASLTEIKKHNCIISVSQQTQSFCDALQDKIKQYGISVTQVGSMFSLFFSEKKPQCLSDVKNSDINRFNQFYHHLLEQGVYFPPSAYEACFTSIMHTPMIYEKTEKIITNILDL